MSEARNNNLVNGVKMLIGKRGTIPKGKFAMAAVCSRLAVLFCLFFFAASIIEAATPTSVQFTAASSDTVSASWVLDDPGAQYPLVALSLVSDFSTTVSSGTMALGAQATTYLSLNPNTTYYFKVKVSVESDASYSATISTITRIETPTDMTFEVSTAAIVALAVGAPGFTNLGEGLSATNVAIDETYAGWHTGANTWTTKANIPTSRSCLSAAAVGGKIYAIGASNTITGNKNEEYDPVANTWTTKANIPTPRGCLATAVVSGKIYAIGGGWGGGTGDENEEYDPLTNTWSTKADMPTYRSYLVAAAVGGKIYAMGGWGAVVPINKNEEYNPETDTWSTKAVLPTARRQLCAATLDGKIYAVGGIGAATTGKNEEYDPANGVDGTWITKTDMPTARYDLAAAVTGGKIYALGGYFGTQKENEEYDPVTDIWVTKADMPTARGVLAGAAVGGKIYTLQTAINEEYDPGIAQRFTGLIPNTEYDFKAKARNMAGTETAESVIVSTYTLAYSSGPASFPGIYPSSITVAWSTGSALGGYNGPGATYFVQASNLANFSTIAGSSQTANIFATVEGLYPPTTFFFRIKAMNSIGVWNNYAIIGSKANG
ncbi:MAG: hypothetical protein L6420_05105, partial [Elusimicrobia bacterium]|nr:hypothetical protein [Elusimicrobiota bacterium]